MKFKARLIGTIVLLLIVSVLTAIEITSYIVNTNIDRDFTKSINSTAKMTYNYIEEKLEGEWSYQEGKLYKGELCLNNNTILIDKIKQDTNYYVTLFAMDTRISTNIIIDGERFTGTVASDDVTDTVINKGQIYQGVTNVGGMELVASYLPLKDTYGTVVGMLFIGTPRITTNELRMNGVKTNISILILISILLIVSTVIYLNGIIKAMRSNVNQLNLMSNKDFTSTVKDKLIKRKDEFGDVFKATNNMQRMIGLAMSDIHSSSYQVNNAIINTTSNLSDLEQTTDKIAAVTQEMAASFEETAASTEEINASIIEMKQAVKEVSEQVKESEKQAELSAKKSLEVKEGAKNSIHSTMQIIEQNRELITKAIEQSNSIEQISRLSDTILDIASETNLLSLNASIEAARAGESGRSFAVVANQIKNLSESSQKAVAEIQSVVQVVIQSVANLASTSKDLMNFIDQKVTGDYKILESTGEEYYNSTQYFENILKEISGTSEELLSRVEMISSSVNEVTNATNDNSEGVTQIADNIVNVNSKVNEVLDIMKKTEDISNLLDEIASSFKTQTY